MPVIAIQQDPSCIERPILHEVDNGTNVLDWLVDNLEFPDRLGVSVLLNGDTIADIDEHDEQEFNCNINFEVNDRDCVVIMMRPRGAEVIYAVVAAVISIAISLALTPKPSLPNNTGKRTDSPNNQLNAATNTFRPRQAIPDIAGQVVSYPDFIQPSYYVYQNNKKQIKEIFCIGRGQYLVEEVKSGSTLIDDVSDWDYTVHPPGSVPSELLNVRSSNEVDGQEIPPPDNTDATVSLDGATVNSPDQIVGFDVAGAEISVGDLVNIDMTWNGGTDSLSGQFEVSSLSGGSGIRLASVNLNQSQSVGDVLGSLTNPSATSLGQWFTLEGDEISEIRYQVQMPQGIRDENDDVANIILNLEAEVLDSNGDPTGVVISSGANISGKTQNPQYRTFYLSDLNPSRYRARITRTTDSIPSPGVDLVKLEALQSVTPYSGSKFGDVTLLEVDRRATTQPLASTQSKINALVTRKLQTFDSPSTYVATRSFADYVYYILSTQAGEPDSQINTDELFGIVDSLSTPELGYFDFTFDDSDIGMRERIETACNVARVRYFNLPRPRWNFVREEAQQIRVAMFNRRNILPASSSQVYKFQRTADYDSVEVRYTDPDSNTEVVINRAWNGSSIIDGVGFRALEIDLAGCRSEAQAVNRADLEIRKLVYQRRRVNDTVMNEGQFVGLGQLVQWADPNDSEIFAGEIAGVSGDTFDTFERVRLESGTTYFVNITSESGAVSNTATVTARTDTDYGFIASGLSGAFVASGAVQLGSKYFIYKDGELTDLLITALDRPDEQGNVPIEGVEYIERVYENDVT